MERNIYLKKASLEKAQKLLLEHFKDYELKTEKVKTKNSQNRVTAQAVYAEKSAPDFYASAMDGIAVKADQTNYASERKPVILEKGKDFTYVDTGDSIPQKFNAVIKIEEIEIISEEEIEVIKSVPVWHNIRSIGESVIKQQLILPANTEIEVFDIGAMLEAGVTEVEVYQKPKVGIIPTGSELVSPESDIKKGQLVDFNSTMLKLSAENWGSQATNYGIVKDDYDKIKKNIIKANGKNDLTIIIAGSSAGREDFTLSILQKLGEVLVHGIEIMPGKPLIIAEVNNKPVIGIPGYPLSALLDFNLFVKPLIKSMYGLEYGLPIKLKAKVKKKIPSTAGLKEFVRVNLTEIENELVAVPQKRGSASMHSLINADGVMPIKESKEGIFSGDFTDVYILKSKSKIKNNLMMIGSHDLAVDKLINQIKKNKENFELNIQSVGSMSGLVSLKRGECQLAGAHLLEPETGEYNISYINDLFKNEKMAVINLVHREQGLMVKKNNPKNLEDINSLKEKNIKFINRQRGSGTRVLLDYLLKTNNIDKTNIKGYEKEELTHMGAAVQVAEGTADAALGIRAAASAVDLDFIPIKKEKYDIILKKKSLNDPRIKRLINIIKSSPFQKVVKELKGYDLKNSGEINIIE
ncbi:MAG: molybdopterin biosynthesis protein [Halanaerobiales bacterium]|nr:molybdopterin biosynthesis protein [Halanaerobiales bacterium]